MFVHPTAILSDQTEVAKGATIGPYVVTKGQVKIGKGTVVNSHLVIGSDRLIVEIGENNHFMSSSVIGGPPQDLTYKGESTKLIIGNNNVIREFCTLNAGTEKGGGVTRIGDNCLLMAYVHVAHDCTIKNHVIVANNTHFAGHIVVEDYVKIGGGCLFAQFTTLGTHCYIAGDTTIDKDVMPYTIAYNGSRGTIRSTNKVGLERAGFSKEEINNIHKAIRTVTKDEHLLEEAVVKIEQECEPSNHIKHIVDFIKNSKRGIVR